MKHLKEPNINKEVEELYQDVIKPAMDSLQRELLGRVEFFISKDDSRFAQWKGFIFTQCQNCGRDIRDDTSMNYDLIKINQILSVKF